MIREFLRVDPNFLWTQDSSEGPECVRRRVAHARADRLDALFPIKEEGLSFPSFVSIG